MIEFIISEVLLRRKILSGKLVTSSQYLKLSSQFLRVVVPSLLPAPDSVSEVLQSVSSAPNPFCHLSRK